MQPMGIGKQGAMGKHLPTIMHVHRSAEVLRQFGGNFKKYFILVPSKFGKPYLRTVEVVAHDQYVPSKRTQSLTMPNVSSHQSTLTAT